jgi:hypothetical protein
VPRKYAVNQPLRDQVMREWHARYGDALPLGHMFKDQLNDRWTRIHTLPKAKRYAQIKAEHEEVAHRQHVVIRDLIGEEAEIRVIITQIGMENPLFQMRAPDYIGTLSSGQGEPSYHLFTFLMTWEIPDCVLLAMIADDQIKAFLIGPDCLVAPYDGGVDVVLTDTQAVRAFKQRYQAWLSDREDGL